MPAPNLVQVATTRPETILGDSAVCVHPEDQRYNHLIGKTVVLPVDTALDGGGEKSEKKRRREIPIIADEYVDMEFGTGALKITPAHDPNDYALGKKHNLELINIMNKDATINNVGVKGKYEGLDRYAARAHIWEDMEAKGTVIKGALVSRQAVTAKPSLVGSNEGGNRTSLVHTVLT